MRKSVFEEIGMYYHLAYVTAEDFELWTRFVTKSSIYILDEKLVQYRAAEDENKISGNGNGRKNAFPNVWMLVRKRLIETLSDEAFIEFFKEDFINQDSVSHDELECERAHILLNCSGNHVNFIGLEKYEQLLGDKKNLNLLEEKMDFSLSAYYKEYRVLNFGISQELEQMHTQIQNLENINADLRRKNEELNQVKLLLEEVLNSTSWKVTEPLRKIMFKIKKLK